MSDLKEVMEFEVIIILYDSKTQVHQEKDNKRVKKKENWRIFKICKKYKKVMEYKVITIHILYDSKNQVHLQDKERVKERKKPGKKLKYIVCNVSLLIGLF